MEIIERYKSETAREYALRILRSNIISMHLQPGAFLSENELAMEMGVSRTPVREALIELSKAQIVEIYPQKGSMISFIDPDLVEEARFLRYVLEPAIVEMACDVSSKQDIFKLEENIRLQEFYLENPAPNKLLEMDDAFHKKLYSICKKERTYYMIKGFMIHFDRVRNLSLSTIKDIKIVSDHKAITAAIANGDKAEAKAVIEKHLSRYKIDEKTMREQYPQFFKKQHENELFSSKDANRTGA
ncbi:GntR family transcriptional regulator [Anoxynatronum buryatiense]|uniref:DNA-binding transcriptional regulator, GntR family n=1 Tax=Anoxynatronum buryatiense TaxID=489973 RepID=A0AA46AJ98_9CLOT|nr:GntR family transcriptional regulator [Anoxynatronum buryatiense]SMP59044.1 DNA-binding transcriptional regulator, GntR family [Anoxynatronum buryatiense]